MRTRLCGTLRAGDVGSAVTVCGWVAKRREHGEHLAFIDLRDHTGIVQCVVPGTVDVRSEYVLAVEGVVRLRPEGTVNPDLPTGEVEIGDCTVTVLNAGRAAALRRGRPGRGRRGHPAAAPLRRPAPAADAGQPPPAGHGQPGPAGGHGPPGVRRGGDAAAVGAHPRGGPGVRRAQPAEPRAPATCCPRARSWPSSC